MKSLTAEEDRKTFHAYHVLCNVMDNPIPNKRQPMSLAHFKDIEDFSETNQDILRKVTIEEPAPVISQDLKAKIAKATRGTLKEWIS